tara:strand:+ start:1725 stop:2033 length:309 start_codon:yes stop_codon:yes gene_type:complete
MSLSEENLGKLKNFVKEHNFVNNNSIENPQEPNNSSKVDDPSKIFYSIIDQAENINETFKENPLLKKSEDKFHNINSRKTNYSNNLSIEDELYDEFNYLLDE